MRRDDYDGGGGAVSGFFNKVGKGERGKGTLPYLAPEGRHVYSTAAYTKHNKAPKGR